MSVFFSYLTLALTRLRLPDQGAATFPPPLPGPPSGGSFSSSFSSSFNGGNS